MHTAISVACTTSGRIWEKEGEVAEAVEGQGGGWRGGGEVDREDQLVVKDAAMTEEEERRVRDVWGRGESQW